METWGNHLQKNLRGFDVEVLCYDLKPNVGDENCRQVSLEELQEKADCIKFTYSRNST